MSFVIINESGEYFNGILIMKEGERIWRLKFSPDIYEARIYSSASDLSDDEKVFEIFSYTNGVRLVPAPETIDNRTPINYQFYLNGERVQPPSQKFPDNVSWVSYPHSQIDISINTICKKADEAKDNKFRLITIFSDVNDRRDKYKPYEFEFIKEHIQNYLDKIEAKEKLYRIDE